MIPVSFRMALRNLLRHTRRTVLSVAGIALGCALAVLLASMIRGMTDLYAQVIAETGTGHVQLLPEGFLPAHEKALRLHDAEAALAAAQKTPGAIAVAPRVRIDALLAMGNRTAGVELVGVDPDGERAANRNVRRLGTGRYLQADDVGAVVLGKPLAERLRVGVDDELVATAVAPGGFESALLRIVGIVDSGSKLTDANLAQVPLVDARRLSGSQGLGEISILLRSADALPEATRFLSARLAPGDEAIGWEALSDVDDHLRQDEGVYRLLSGIMLLLVVFGLAGAQITLALERRREFAVLTAVGMSTRRVAAQLLGEAFLLGLLGAGVALLLVSPLLWYLSTIGLDLSRFLSEEISFQGSVIPTTVYTSFGPWVAGFCLATALGSTLIAAVYPAWFAARTDPADALRVAL